MELTILKDESKPLLHRRELRVRIVAESKTPDRLKVAKAIANKIKADIGLVVINHIRPVFGGSLCDVDARIYSDAGVLKKLERPNLLEKHNQPEPKTETEADKVSDDKNEASA